MPTYKLKNSKRSITTTKPIEYINGHWFADGKRIGNWTLSQIQYKDSDGYYKTPMPDGSLAVQDVDDKGNPNKHGYIGGTTNESRATYWKEYPIMRHATDSIANQYDISPSILRSRLNHEGFVDDAIRRNNNGAISGNYDELNGASILTGFSGFGLDDVGTFIKEGKVKIKNEKYYTSDNKNEHDRDVVSTDGITTKDNIGLVAATLQYMRSQAKKDFPGASRRTLDEAADIYYNRGITGGRNYMKKKNK